MHALTTPGPGPRPSWRGRWREAAWCVAVVVLLHAWLLGGDLAGWLQAPPVQRPAAAAVQVRQVVVVRVPEAPAVAVAPSPPARAATRAPVTAAQPPVAVPRDVPPAVDVEPAALVSPPEPPVPTDVPVAEMVAPAVPLAASAAEPMPAAPATEGTPPPVYATRLPPPFTQAYALRRGSLSGSADLVFTLDAGVYELSLQGRVLGIDVIGLVSRGGVDAAGLAPERFVDRRRGRDRLAANFDRTAGRIVYSGPQVSYPLLPGAQDRLSWMVQLPAIVDADPQRWQAGSRIAAFVSGARGDAAVWTFEVHGREDLDLAGRQVAGALRLTRQPRKPYDTEVEIWLDPARHHLPVRARLTTLPGGDTLELTIEP